MGASLLASADSRLSVAKMISSVVTISCVTSVPSKIKAITPARTLAVSMLVYRHTEHIEKHHRAVSFGVVPLQLYVLPFNGSTWITFKVLNK